MEKVENMLHKSKGHFEVANKEDKEDGKWIVSVKKDKFKLSKKKGGFIVVETSWSTDLEVR